MNRLMKIVFILSAFFIGTNVCFASSKLTDQSLCLLATTKMSGKTIWSRDKSQNTIETIAEAKRRRLSCGVEDITKFKNVSDYKKLDNYFNDGSWCWNSYLGIFIWYDEKECISGKKLNFRQMKKIFKEDFNLTHICRNTFGEENQQTIPYFYLKYKFDLNCSNVNKLANKKAKPEEKNNVTNSSEELMEAKRKAEDLEKQLADIKAQQELQEQTILSDTELPKINIESISSSGAQGIIVGNVNDNSGIAELRVDGMLTSIQSNGDFLAKTYVPEGGVRITIEAIDIAGLSKTISVWIDRKSTQTASVSFDRLNPLNRKVKVNKDALALVIGISEYKETNANAIYSDSDANVFKDYAIEKLGVPSNRVKTLVNKGADEKDMLLAVKRWLARASKQGKTDVYIFFAGHGLASDDGSKMYLLPYDGAPELLDDTAILRERLFNDIAATNPRSVTVFLDTCYSGTTRGTDMLIASRPIAIRAIEQPIPDNFTVFTAAAGDQTAKPLEEAKHGMFSYFLMKGMEGEADTNMDNKITAHELHEFIYDNVVQQSSGSQTPELQGDAERVLVTFQ